MKRKQLKSASVMFLGLLLLFSGTLSYTLLAFAYRDFSLTLLAMFVFTIPTLMLGWYLLDKGARADFKRKPMAISTRIATVSRELEELSRR